jgi:signal transduction histidine kinase
MKNHTFAYIPVYITALFIICLVGLAGNAVFIYGNMQKLIQYYGSMERAWSVRDHLKNINLLVMDEENSLDSYYLSGNRTFLKPEKTTEQELNAEFNVIAALIDDDSQQKKNLAQLHTLFDRRMKKFKEAARLSEDGGLKEIASAAKLSQDWETMDEVRLLDVIMEKEELELLMAGRNRFYGEYKRALWIGNTVAGLAMLVLILFYRLIQKNFAKQRAVEDALKTANENLETTVLARTGQLSLLSRHLLKVSEEEKAKLARELHDEMGSNLTAIRMDISMVIDKLKKTHPAMAEQLLRAKRTLQETVDLKRRIMEDLRPSMLDNLGLGASIRNYCEEITRIAGLSYELDMAEDFDNIDPASAIALFRIAQESLNNIIKYAQATQVKIALKRQDAGLWMQILDDGVGMPKDALKKPRSHGLLGMRERALLLGGNFIIRPGPSDRGTAIEVFLPFPRIEQVSPK